MKPPYMSESWFELLQKRTEGKQRTQVAKTLVETARVRAQKTGRPDDITAAVLRLEKC